MRSNNFVEHPVNSGLFIRFFRSQHRSWDRSDMRVASCSISSSLTSFWSSSFSSLLSFLSYITSASPFHFFPFFLLFLAFSPSIKLHQRKIISPLSKYKSHKRKINKTMEGNKDQGTEIYSKNGRECCIANQGETRGVCSHMLLRTVDRRNSRPRSL